MPHFHIDYSANLESHVDVALLCDVIRKTAITIDTFPMAGVRVRAIRVDHCSMADGDPKHGFIDISIRLREGRAKDVKLDAVTRVFEAAKNFLAPALKGHSIALSTEIRDIDADLSPKFGTIRDHLEKTA